MSTTTDRIEKKVNLKASKARIWRALTDATEFGAWFRVKLEGPFVKGKTTLGTLTVPKYEHLRMELLVEEMKGEEYFAFRWHPYAIDTHVDYSKEPMTLVEFRLEATASGTLLTVIESGFDKIPAARRDEAFRMNEGGWAMQVENVRRHVDG